MCLASGVGMSGRKSEEQLFLDGAAVWSLLCGDGADSRDLDPCRAGTTFL